MTQLSKQTIFQGDFCPRNKFDEVENAHTIFFHYMTYNLSKLFTGKRFHGQKSPRTIVCLDNCVIGQKSLGQLSPWTIAPWTIVATPLGSVIHVRHVETITEYCLIPPLQKILQK